eukprot:TRINITY_DN8670_c0_g6_i1.p1 TRINITY_DN8670_c0_g6~~TRINITY_DN8670_c0_g6_i1.p1  ORF type:complete len:854 (+),score=104.49 TRINITY_DN8670_c0_g6_i1:68-2563(+)
MPDRDPDAGGGLTVESPRSSLSPRGRIYQQQGTGSRNEFAGMRRRSSVHIPADAPATEGSIVVEAHQEPAQRPPPCWERFRKVPANVLKCLRIPVHALWRRGLQESDSPELRHSKLMLAVCHCLIGVVAPVFAALDSLDKSEVTADILVASFCCLCSLAALVAHVQRKEVGVVRKIALFEGFAAMPLTWAARSCRYEDTSPLLYPFAAVVLASVTGGGWEVSACWWAATALMFILWGWETYGEACEFGWGPTPDALPIRFLLRAVIPLQFVFAIVLDLVNSIERERVVTNMLVNNIMPPAAADKLRHHLYRLAMMLSGQSEVEREESPDVLPQAAERGGYSAALANIPAADRRDTSVSASTADSDEPTRPAPRSFGKSRRRPGRGTSHSSVNSSSFHSRKSGLSATGEHGDEIRLSLQSDSTLKPGDLALPGSDSSNLVPGMTPADRELRHTDGTDGNGDGAMEELNDLMWPREATDGDSPRKRDEKRKPPGGRMVPRHGSPTVRPAGKEKDRDRESPPPSPRSDRSHSILSTTSNTGSISVASFFDAQQPRAQGEVRMEQRGEVIVDDALLDAVLRTSAVFSQQIAQPYTEAAVMFTDVVGFTQQSSTMDPQRVVHDLHALVAHIDILCMAHRVQKVKTIGDAYMAWIPKEKPGNEHLSSLLEVARHLPDNPAMVLGGHVHAVRVGLHAGPVVAGLIGITKWAWDLWGDAVNTASRMESTGVPGRVHVSEKVYTELREVAPFESRGQRKVKGKGMMNTYLLSKSGHAWQPPPQPNQLPQVSQPGLPSQSGNSSAPPAKTDLLLPVAGTGVVGSTGQLGLPPAPPPPPPAS